MTKYLLKPQGSIALVEEALMKIKINIRFGIIFRPTKAFPISK